MYKQFEQAFNKRMGEETVLWYAALKWTDKEAVAVGKVIDGRAEEARGIQPPQQPDWRYRRDGTLSGEKGTLPQLKPRPPAATRLAMPA